MMHKKICCVKHKTRKENKLESGNLCFLMVTKWVGRIRPGDLLLAAAQFGVAGAISQKDREGNYSFGAEI